MNKLLVRTLQVVVGLVAITAAVVWLSGGFGDRVAPGKVEPVAGPPPDASETAAVELVLEASFEWASGALASARQTAISSRILARIEDIRVGAGDFVAEGDTLVVLDSRDYESRLRQVGEALRGAQAQLELAQAEKDRAETLLQSGTGTQQRLDRANSDLLVAQAESERLEQSLTEARTALSHTVIQSPASGRVIDRLAEPGDTASPGGLLLRIYDPSVLRVEVPVRESLAIHLAVGQPLAVEIPAMEEAIDGVIDEIVPFAEPGARTLLIKVRLPPDPRLFAGMFARVAVPAGERTRLVMPASAVERIGQLEFATVIAPDGRLERRLVTTAEIDRDGRVEVLSGLREGDRVVAAVCRGSDDCRGSI